MEQHHDGTRTGASRRTGAPAAPSTSTTTTGPSGPVDTAPFSTPRTDDRDREPGRPRT